jgi:hypothetical protein
VGVQQCRASGGHVCENPCSTANPIAVQNCAGANNKCGDCGYRFCEYHEQQVGMGAIAGGHVCKVCCDTSPQYQSQCNGKLAKCKDCPYRFCAYHGPAVSNALVPAGGHVCTTTFGGAAANLVGQVALPVAAAAGVVVFTIATGGAGGVALAASAGGAALTASGVKGLLTGVTCSTGTVFKHMCEGCGNCCEFCGDDYCIYHLHSVENAVTDAKGGHVCKGVTWGGGVACAVATGIECGIAIKSIVDGRAALQGAVGGSLKGLELAGEAKKAKDAYDAAAAAGKTVAQAKAAADGILELGKAGKTTAGIACSMITVGKELSGSHGSHGEPAPER